VYERCLHEAQRILAADKDVIVPVKKVWNEVLREGRSQSFEVPALADFTALLEADPAFEFMSAHNGVLDDMEEERAEDMTEEEENLERMGFYAGDRVKLKRITLTPEALGGILRSKVDRTVDALAKAWEQRPPGDSETEDRLLSIIEETRKLQRDVKQAFSAEKLKRITKALKHQEPSPAPARKRTKARPAATGRKRSAKRSPKATGRKRPRR
jgi:hypothetical protein